MFCEYFLLIFIFYLELMAKSKTKYVFVTGGVMSSVGKGVSTASLAYLLKQRGYKVTAVKYEGYLNIDAGTINPIEHGDAFLCTDGTEADMDLGTYERYLGQEMRNHNFYTFGKVLKSVLDKERSMYYEGDDVEPIPHVRDEIIEEIVEAGKKDKADIVFTELGGTVGEPTNSMNSIYYDAIRKMKSMYPDDVVHMHVGYILFPKHLGEPKTKPVQISVRLLMANGIMPDFLIVRGERKIDSRRKFHLARFTDLDKDHTIGAHDVDNIYKIPLNFFDQKFDETLIKDFNLPVKKKFTRKQLESNLKFLDKKPTKEINLTIAGKYFNTGEHQLLDSYFALIEAVKHASWKLGVKINFNYVNTEQVEKNGTKKLEGSDAIIVPIGWGTRGAEGKIEVIKYARENKIPYLGLCYGMQLAAVEFARNVVGLKNANSEEIDPKTKHQIIHSIPFDEKYQTIKGTGTSMRLGAFDCIIKKDTLAWSIYDKHKEWKGKKGLISERHRHRFEFNNSYRKQLEEQGLIISGTSPDDFFVEMVELPKEIHPFFIATQAHPEYKSTPWKPHPMFLELIETASKLK